MAANYRRENIDRQILEPESVTAEEIIQVGQAWSVNELFMCCQALTLFESYYLGVRDQALVISIVPFWWLVVSMTGDHAPEDQSDHFNETLYGLLISFTCRNLDLTSADAYSEPSKYRNSPPGQYTETGHHHANASRECPTHPPYTRRNIHYYSSLCAWKWTADEEWLRFDCLQRNGLAGSQAACRSFRQISHCISPGGPFQDRLSSMQCGLQYFEPVIAK